VNYDQKPESARFWPCVSMMTCSKCIVHVLNQSKRLQSFPFFFWMFKRWPRSAQLRLSSARDRWVDWQFCTGVTSGVRDLNPMNKKNQINTIIWYYLNNLCWVAANQTVQTCFVCGLRFASLWCVRSHVSSLIDALLQGWREEKAQPCWAGWVWSEYCWILLDKSR